MFEVRLSLGDQKVPEAAGVGVTKNPRRTAARIYARQILHQAFDVEEVGIRAAERIAGIRLPHLP